jgi:CubicO group peptidase (beta-lactamase class C family)
MLDRWARKPLNFDPGTRWQYSNTNYVLAGEIFEKVSGQPLVSFLREKIFKPLGMQSADDCSAASLLTRLLTRVMRWARRAQCSVRRAAGISRPASFA